MANGGDSDQTPQFAHFAIYPFRDLHTKMAELAETATPVHVRLTYNISRKVNLNFLEI